jgi:predicted deacylase
MTMVLPTVDVLVGPRPGPVVGILGGIHGDEYEGVLAAAQLRRELPSRLLRGEIRIAAPAHPAAWKARSRTSPSDGANLARVFPGRSEGSPTEQIAHFLTYQLICGTDLLIDLHSAGAHFDMPLLCGYHTGNDHRAEAPARFAEAFAAPFTWIHDGVPAPGRSISAAFELGVTALYVEGHGGLSIRAEDLDMYLNGVRRVLHVLGMLEGAPAATCRPVRVRGDGDTDAGIVAPASGYLVAHCRGGTAVTSGQLIAIIVQVDGTPTAEIRAPHNGFVMLLRRDARVSTGDTVCIVATGSDT